MVYDINVCTIYVVKYTMCDVTIVCCMHICSLRCADVENICRGITVQWLTISTIKYIAFSYCTFSMFTDSLVVTDFLVWSEYFPDSKEDKN